MHDNMLQSGMDFALSSSSSSFCSNEEFISDRIQTRLVWITNYKTDVDFPIHVAIDDPLLHLNCPSSTAHGNETKPLDSHIQAIDLTKLNLDDLLFLLYRLQQRTTTKNSLMTSPSSSSTSSSDLLNRPPSSYFLTRRPSFFTLSNIADLPKQVTTTLTQSISSSHPQPSKHLHSPNDVVNKLLQSYQQIPHYTYQQSEQYKANLIAHSLSK